MANPLLEVQKYGQSIWYDNTRRGLITSGELVSMVEKDGLLGVTSNPSLLETALTGSTDYDQALKAVLADDLDTAGQLYEHLAIQDTQLAADVLYPVYIRTRGKDGYVSLELSPLLAHDTRETVEEARRLYDTVRRDNVMIQVPATPAGIPAIRQLVAAGISIHVTLLFDVAVYAQAVDAYLAGLEDYAGKGGDVSKVASVASFFVSPLDNVIDHRLELMLDATTDVVERPVLADPARRKLLKGLVGKVALANARLAYARFRDLVASERWQKLAAQKAMPQRLLWAGTSTRNPKSPRTWYIEELIGPDTITTMSAETYAAFRESGRARPSLTQNWAENLDAARETLGHLREAGISLDLVTRTLLEEEIVKLGRVQGRLLAGIERKRQGQRTAQIDTQAFSLAGYEEAVREALDDWRVEGKVRRLWAGDASLWTGTDEGGWLAWLHTPEVQAEHGGHLAGLAEEVRSAGFRHVVILGMGGSALGPELLARTLGRKPDFPEMLILDTIAPPRVREVLSAIDPGKALFVVSSKSGGTVETGALFATCLDRVRQAVGAERAGAHFLAITDPKTRLHSRAKAEHFRHIFFTPPGAVGRFAGLSNLGMVPATLLGVDVPGLLHGAQVCAHACASCVPPELNPGVALGVALGTLAQAGRDKVTLLLPVPLASLGAWLMQLVCESTGKDGKGLVVVDGEPLGPPEVYGDDRVFVQIRLRSDPAPEQEAAVAALESAGHPVLRIHLAGVTDLAQEMFRWQLATAAAAAVLGVNPFSQPDVEASKVAARARLSAYEETGRLPEPLAPLAQEDGLALYAEPRNADVLVTQAGGHKTLEALLRAHLGRLEPGDYFSINAFLGPSPAALEAFASIRRLVRDARRVATMAGYGPRLLHSTGQLHKGGPDTGVFVQLTADETEDVGVPGQKYTFGVLNRAQALGDFEVLAQHGRRLVRLHLGKDVAGGLDRLRGLVQAALR